MNPIEVKNLKKSYGDVIAVDNVSFEVRSGEIFGLIGPDGAGKTTIIRTIVSLLNIDEGQVFFQGKQVQEDIMYVRANIGYMPQRFSLYQDLTVEENLRFFGDLFQVPAQVQKKLMKRLYEFSKLGPFSKRKAGALSGGMKQKLALSCMLMHEPKVLVLDEPTFGVDPVSRSEFWDILKSLAQSGTTILVSTAYMDEAGLCNRVGLIFEGKILALDEPDKLLKEFSDTLFNIKTEHPHLVFEKLQSSEFSKNCNLFGGGVHLADHKNYGAEKIKRILQSLNIDYKDIEKIEPNLEDLFLKLMNR
jgi:ABC-2 type transport system ATP-binding protein